jgi:phosphatidylglycerol lysyltransferase
VASVAPGHPAFALSATPRSAPVPRWVYFVAVETAVIAAAFVASRHNVAVLAGAFACAIALGAVLQRRAMASRPFGVAMSTVSEAVVRYGHTHINSYAAAPDKRAVGLPGGGVVAFRVSSGVAITAGDPLDDPETQAQSIAEFVQLRRVGGWLPCFFQVDPRLRSAYRALGMRLVKFGEEAIVDVSSFTLATPKRANLRREVSRAQRAGLSATVLPWTSITPALYEELNDVSRTWLRGRGGEMGFSMGRLEETIDRQAWLTVVRHADGSIHAFSSWLRMGEDGLALDMVRRRPDAGPGAVDLCLAETLQEAQRRGLRRASLGSVPFRDTLGDAPDGRVSRWIRGRLHRSKLHGYCYGSLASFKQKFAPDWVSRDIAFPRGTALLVLLALVRVHMTRNDAAH